VCAQSERWKPPSEVRIIDTGSLIELKKLIPLKDQWTTFKHMEALVDSGHLAFPRHVAREMRVARFPDAPGVWAAGCNGNRRYRDPADASVAEVLGVAQLIDPNSDDEHEAADPYIAAMAYEISERWPDRDVVVVTEDRIDRLPLKESLVTACQRLSLKTCSSEDFINWLQARLH
jgi:hypothetical protein